MHPMKFTWFPTAQLPQEQKNKAAAALNYLFFADAENAPDGIPSLYIMAARNTRIPIRSYTVRYRFSAVPIDEEDRDHPWFEVKVTEGINKNQYILTRVRLTKNYEAAACVAYISEIAADAGTQIFGPENYVTLDQKAMNLRRSLVFEEAEDIHSADGKKPEAALRYSQRKDRKKKKSGIGRIFGVMAAVLCILIAAAGVAVYSHFRTDYVVYQNTMRMTELFTQNGLRFEAEQYADQNLKDNYFYRQYKREVTEVADKLIAEERYPEAYRILSDTPYASRVQETCELAAEYALAQGDYETAYVYAVSAPDSFGAEVYEAAEENAFYENSTTLNPSACRVLNQGDDPAAVDRIVETLTREAIADGKVNYALALTDQISDRELAEDLRTEAVSSAAEEAYRSGDRELLEYYAAEYPDIVDPDELNTLRKKQFDAYIAAKDYRSAAAYGEPYGFTVAAVHPATSEEPGVRLALDLFYPMLTESEKRVYHGNTIAASNAVIAVDNGTAIVTEYGKQKTIQNVAAVESGDFFTLFLHTDGTLTFFSHRANSNPNTAQRASDRTMEAEAGKINGAVGIAAGADHAVVLFDDGTVKAFGDDTYGQCATDDWKDIVAVAAGKRFTVGLKSDGTLVACGSDASGQTDLSGYHNVVDVRACSQTAVMLFEDGTVGIQGERSLGLADAEDWKDIVKIRAGSTVIAGEKSDGTWVLAGGYVSGTPTPDELIVDDLAIGDFFLAVQKDGEVITIGAVTPQTP